ncbi:RHS repeat-associated core domain [Corynebacterium mustelae]|uniref:RHS repeat-associated core domain n=1 Tax=Corynebacterium mustelae TaxID=571915 RepID=A0A0G3H1A7_9CORY|nr:RHS repeat-associated core domain-containing protein [Corynebacterium mustelae]AKK04887.1 RHS repeat-associated core domain [Corynebacterium mustelae]
MAKETIDTGSGQVLVRVMFTHTGDLLTGEHTTYTTTPDTALAAGVTTGGDGVVGRMWIYDPDTTDPIGQLTLTTHGQQVAGVVSSDPSRVLSWSQEQVDVVFAAMTTDLAGAPLELVDPDSGEVTGCSVQSLYGQRVWRGKNQCPLLFAGQYEDAESGWVYNRYRYYQPEAGMYNAQDPLGVSPNIATPQGYVTNPTVLIDYYGLKYCPSAWRRTQLGRDFARLSSHQKGVLGELAARRYADQIGLEHSTDRLSYTVGQRNRISDGILSDKITKEYVGIPEDKAVKRLGRSKQILDGIKFTENQGSQYHLFVLKDTKISRPLMREIEANDHVFLHRINESQIYMAGRQLGYW